MNNARAWNSLRFFFTFFVLGASLACDSDDEVERSALVKSGVLGRWELQSRSIDGITPLIREVGSYLTFLEDKDRSDLIGNFEAISPGSETDGIFELIPANEEIRFEFRERALTYAYELQGDALVFNYEEDGANINEIWIRSELIP